MYRYISALLSDRKGGEVFVCFGGYHFLYILLTALICAAVFIYARGRDGEKRMRTAKEKRAAIKICRWSSSTLP